MSFELYNREQIVNHPENNSPSKFMYSFGKAPRFPSLKKNNISDLFYNLPSTKMKRTTTFGFGPRINFIKNQSNAGYLYIKRDSDKGNEIGPKFSFGISREKFRKVICPGIHIVDDSIPGPASYNIRKNFGYDSPKCSMHAKLKSSLSFTKNNNSPGPGEYPQVNNINCEGKYVSSSICNVSSTNFGLDKTKRFFQKYNNNPGPGSYNLRSLLGINFISKYKSGSLISMRLKLKKKMIKDNTPGPGAYSSFSEFGNIPHTALNKNKIKVWKNIDLSPLNKDKSLSQ